LYIYHLPNMPKMLQETLAVCQSLLGQSNDPRKMEHIQRLQDVINECKRKRPIGSNGKHDNRHTNQCGCNDEHTETERRETWHYIYD
jgi:ABC-type nickel/cobalt efflux system permease component RcnA